MKSELKPTSRRENLVVQELEGELLIYDLKIDKVFSLNETSAAVWQMCDGEKDIAEISRLMSLKFKIPLGEDFVWLALDNLKKENLLMSDDNIESQFEGMSRRQIIRKIGFGSMIALPVVASIVAPTGIMAQSIAPGSVALFGACTSSVQCSSAAPNCNSGICCAGDGSRTAGQPSGSGCSGPPSFCNPSSTALCNPCCSGMGTVSCTATSPTNNNCTCMCT